MNMLEMNMLEMALDLAKEGWRVFPVAPRDKIPLVERWQEVATSTDRNQIIGWWERHPQANIGIVTGQGSNLWVLDVDGEEGEQQLDALQEEHDVLPWTLEATTGKGRHLYFMHADGVRNTSRKLGPGLDTRGEGGYVLAPPSVHPNGKQYEWSSATGDPVAAPDWLVNLVTAEATGDARGDRQQATGGQVAADDGGPIPAGQRNATLTSLAGSMRRRGMTTSAILGALRAENIARCDPPLDQRDVERIATSVARYQPEPEAAQPRKGRIQRVGHVATEYVDFALNPQARSPFGYEGLDATLRGGIAPGELAVLAAGAYTGKTTFMANVAVNNPDVPIMFASIEMTLILVVARLYAMVYGEEYSTLERRLREGDPKLERRLRGELGDALPNLGLMGAGAPSISTLEHAFDDYQDLFERPPKLVMIDYLDLMSPNSENVEAVKRKLISLRAFAKQNTTSVLVAHQLKREVLDERNGKPLRFTDTRYASETEADHLVALYRRINDPDIQESRRLWEQYRWTIHWQALKTRSGEAVGVEEGIELRWNPETLRISDPRPLADKPRDAAADHLRQGTMWEED